MRTVDVDGGTDAQPARQAAGGARRWPTAHDIADEVEDAILQAVPEIDRVHVHLEPLARTRSRAAEADGDDDSRAAVEAAVRRVTGRAPEESACTASRAGSSPS